MKLYIKSTTVYKYNGSIKDKFGNILIRDAEFTTSADDKATAKRNILYKAKKQLGRKPSFYLELCSPENLIEKTYSFDRVARCPHCGTQLSDGGYCPKCYAYGNETNYFD